jgi:hypothetical protein
MANFHSVKLELLRPGPTHNQLLSRLTPYLALCGEGSPITFRIDLDHRDILNRLERLRYLPVQNQVREATVGEVGKEVSDIFSKIPALLAEFSRARSEGPQQKEFAGPQFVHLNLVLGGAELSLIPFEIAVSPQSFPGEGLEFCLQLDLPVVLTRETRRNRRALTSWESASEPKVLFVAADPLNFGVPLIEHIAVLREAIEPWIDWPRRGKKNLDSVTEQDRLDYVKKRIGVISNASLEDIRKRCAQEKFTHVHILAHGGEYEIAGETQYGIVLCADGNPTEKNVVSGKRLAQALQAQGDDGVTRSIPLVVTLATCDSGNVGSVLLPGGSVAHDLHSAGIPWVFASQFPLTKSGSIRLIEALYPGLLRGDDPRQIVYEARRRLYMGNQNDHDWASLVVYASLPQDFEKQIVTFFENRSLAAIETTLSRADDLADILAAIFSDIPSENGEINRKRQQVQKDLNQKLQQVQNVLDVWRLRLPSENNKEPSECSRRAHCYGIHGSVFKRIALMQSRLKTQEEADKTLKKSIANYRKAMDEELSSTEKFHWVATQTLSLGAVLKEPPDLSTFELTRNMAMRNLKHHTVEGQAWAHGTLAELEMIGMYHKAEASAQSLSSIERTKEVVISHCREIVKLMGSKSFHVESTMRQFQRYVDYWDDPRWNEVAKAAVGALS